MAASALASQLQAIALSHTGTSIRPQPRGKPSLLFDPQEAANIDLQTIHRIGKQGFDELCNMDARFEPFAETLFSQVGADFDREMQTKEANEKLDASVTAFLRLLSNYLLLPPAHQALEFLIRRYMIQQYNVEAVLLSALPYHETQLFVRLVQLLDLSRAARWRFLVGRVQQNGAPLPRDSLVLHCSRNLAVLDAVLDAARLVSDARNASKPLLSFSAVIVMEVLAAVASFTDELVKRILPYVLDGFKKGAAVEYQAGVLMIAAQLSNRATLSKSLLSSLLRSLAGSPPPSLQSESLMVIIQIFQTQRPAAIPPKALKALVKFPGLADALGELSQRFDAAPFLRPFLRALVSGAPGNETYEALLVEIVEKVSVGGEVEGLTRNLLALAGLGGPANSDGVAGSDTSGASDGAAVARRVLRVLDKRYSVELDASVNALMKEAAERGDLGADEDESDEGKGGANALFDFMQGTFGGGLHAPLAESGASLYLSVDHPQAEVRRLALQRLGALAKKSKGEGNQQLQQFLGAAVLRRLRDDDPEVVKTALNLPSLVTLTAREPLFEALSGALTASVAALEGSLEVPGDSKAATAVARNALRVLAGDFLGAHPEMAELVGTLFLGHMLVKPKTRKVNREAIAQAAKIAGFPAGLAELTKKFDEEGGDKQTKAAGDAELNDALLSVLAEGLSTNPSEGISLLRSALTSAPRSRPLVLMILLRVLATLRGVKVLVKAEGILKAVLPVLESEWVRAAALGNPEEDPLPEGAADWVRKGENGAAWFKAVRVSPERASLTVLLGAYERAVGLVEDERLGLLFTLLASGPKLLEKEVMPALKRILERAAGAGLTEQTQWLGERFLPKIVLGTGVGSGAAVQEQSLELLTNVVQNGELSPENVFTLAPKLLVALASPGKGVRRAALRAVRALWSRTAGLGADGDDVMEDDSDVADVSAVRKVLEAAWSERQHFRSDGGHLKPFLSELLGFRDPDDGVSVAGELSALRSIFGVGWKWAVSKFLAGALVGTLDTSHQRAVLLGALRPAFVSSRADEQAQVVGQLQPLMFSLLGGGVNTGVSGGESDDTALLVELISLFTPELAGRLGQEGENQPSLEPLVLALQTGLAGSEKLRTFSDAVAIAAAERVDRAFFGALNAPLQDWLTAVLLALMSAASTEALRTSVRRSLESVDLSAAATCRLLALLMEDPNGAAVAATPAKKKKRAGGGKQGAETAPPAQRLLAGSLELGTALLELLQWKELSDGLNGSGLHADALAQQLSALLRGLADRSWPPGGSLGEAVEEGGVPKGPAMPPPRAVYAMQLTLASLERIAAQKEGGDTGRKTRGGKKNGEGPFDVDLVVRCVREAPDAPTRNHALALLAALARVLPEEVLHRLLEVATIVGSSSLALDDSASHRVVQQMLSAVVPAWAAQSGDLDQLLEVFIVALPKVPAHRRMGLLEGLLRSVGIDRGIPRALLLLIRAQVEGVGETPHDEAGSPRSVLVSDAPDDWLVRLADALASQHLPSVRLAAYHKLLEATAISDAPSAADRKLSRAATAFVISQLGQRAFTGLREAAGTEEEEKRVQEGYVSLMEQVLLRLRPIADADGSTSKGKKANTEAAYQLLEALYSLMDPAAYLSGISGLLHHEDRHVRRRVLKLLSTEVKDHSPVAPADNPQTVAQYATLASEIASLLSGPSEDPSPSTKQAALAALEAIAARFGPQASETLGAAIDAVLANAEPPKAPKTPKKAKVVPAEGSVNPAVAAAAIRCAATICASLGPRALPQLPRVLATVLGCAQRQLVAENGDTVPEERLELLTVCIAAVEKLVSNLGAFLSPYLGQILDLVLLQPAVLTSAAAERAAAVRALLPEKVPPRLLLDPVIRAYDRALALGAESERALASLFDLVAALASKLDKAGVAAHHRTVFEFLLRAFDLRRKPPPGVAVGTSVEPAIIRAFVALVVKLSENTFKPLFLKTLEWAETDFLPADEGAESDVMTSKGSLARNTFLYGLVGALAEKLRSVFVPYFKYLMEGVITHLGGSAGQEGEGGGEENVGFRPKKKKKKSAKVAAEGSESSALTPAQWELRRLVTSALQKCFQYDTVGFLEPGRFQQLLPPLVAQLRVDIPEGVDDETSRSSGDETLVSALGYMALAARSDAMWRPLNRDVLMATRGEGENSRPKMLALAVVEFLVDRLREEYLVLLPETIPFLAELLEETDLTVVAKSQGLVKKLEELSGENLADYF